MQAVILSLFLARSFLLIVDFDFVSLTDWLKLVLKISKNARNVLPIFSPKFYGGIVYLAHTTPK